MSSRTLKALQDAETERYRAGEAEPPSVCDICQDVIPDGTGWLQSDLLTCDTCETRLREAQRAVAYQIRCEVYQQEPEPPARGPQMGPRRSNAGSFMGALLDATRETIRAPYEPGEDEKEK